MIAALILALQVGAAPAPPPEPRPDIVVVGRRMRDRLGECIARGCPPEEEVDTAMAAAAESFREGRYKEARSILAESVARNKRYAARMPTRVSDLYATYADVAEHEGEDDVFRLASIDSVAVLRRHLGRTNPTTLAATPRIGDMMVRLGKVAGADDAYRAAATDAREAGDADLAALLTVRRAWLAYQRGDLAGAGKLLAEAGTRRSVEGLVRVLQARVAIARGDDAAADRLIAGLRDIAGPRPALLYAPAYPPVDGTPDQFAALNGEVDTSDAFSSGIYRLTAIRWADIGFWVRPDGTTAEAEILRPARGGDWAKPLLRQIAGRRYTTVTAPAGAPGTFRVERFTLRPSYEVSTGTHISARSGPLTSLHVLDMTEPTSAAKPPNG